MFNSCRTSSMCCLVDSITIVESFDDIIHWTSTLYLSATNTASRKCAKTKSWSMMQVRQASICTNKGYCLRHDPTKRWCLLLLKSTRHDHEVWQQNEVTVVLKFSPPSGVSQRFVEANGHSESFLDSICPMMNKYHWWSPQEFAEGASFSGMCYTVRQVDSYKNYSQFGRLSCNLVNLPEIYQKFPLLGQ